MECPYCGSTDILTDYFEDQWYHWCPACGRDLTMSYRCGILQSEKEGGIPCIEEEGKEELETREEEVVIHKEGLGPATLNGKEMKLNTILSTSGSKGTRRNYGSAKTATK